MMQFLGIFSQSTSGIGALGINGQAFLIQLITFVLVFWILKRYAFKPILKLLKRRQDLIDSGVRLGEQMKQKQVEIEQEINEKLHKARTDADAIIASAQQEARQGAVETEENARNKAAMIVAEADSRIEQEVSEARRKLKGDIVELVTEATEVIIGEKIDQKKMVNLLIRP
jgi:F-type H+-transporting ATPase subunit b